MEAHVRIEGSPGSRRAVARGPLPAGTLVLCEPAAAAVLRRERWHIHCLSCWTRLPTGAPRLRCSRCRLAHFCDARCQARAWKAAHRAECAAFANLARAAAAAELDSGYVALAEDALLVGRLVRRWASLDEQARGALGALCEAPAPRLAQAELVARTAADAGLLDLPPTGGPPRVADGSSFALAAQLARAFDANNFGVLAPLGGGVLGAASFPLSAILNHSCEPTCALAHDLEAGSETDVRQAVRTIVPVRAGCELTHAYVDTSLGAARRRQLLRTGWGFECACARCAAADAGDPGERALDAPNVHDAAAERSLADASRAHAAAIACDEPAEERALLHRALRLRRQHLAPQHAHVRELHAALLACELADGNRRAARAHADELVRSARIAFGARPCASFAMLLLTAAELWSADATVDVDACARACALGCEARALLTLTHGESHPLTRQAGLRCAARFDASTYCK